MKRKFNEKQMEIINNTLQSITKEITNIECRYWFDPYGHRHVIIIDEKTDTMFSGLSERFEPYNYDCTIGFLMGLLKMYRVSKWGITKDKEE